MVSQAALISAQVALDAAQADLHVAESNHALAKRALRQSESHRYTANKHLTAPAQCVSTLGKRCQPASNLRCDRDNDSAAQWRHAVIGTVCHRNAGAVGAAAGSEYRA